MQGMTRHDGVVNDAQVLSSRPSCSAAIATGWAGADEAFAVERIASTHCSWTPNVYTIGESCRWVRAATGQCEPGRTGGERTA
jgi:hypothetical protein